MSSHDYVIPLMAATFMIINLFGAAFTISRIHSRRVQQISGPSTGVPRGFAKSSSFRPKATEVHMLALKLDRRRLVTITFVIAVLALILARLFY
jgi:hypothetical protein